MFICNAKMFVKKHSDSSCLGFMAPKLNYSQVLRLLVSLAASLLGSLAPWFLGS
jgi:hypothetical protein